MIKQKVYDHTDIHTKAESLKLVNHSIKHAASTVVQRVVTLQGKHDNRDDNVNYCCITTVDTVTG